jgi:dipeptidyl aminopeptidase/acylaminoacyl peptidase
MINNHLSSTSRQADEILTRYESAKTLSQGMFKSVVPNSLLFPVWIKETNSFWYERQLTEGKEFRLVNAEAASNELAFSHETLAKALAEASGESVDANNLPINNLDHAIPTIEISPNSLVVNFMAFGKRWEFTNESGSLKELEQVPTNYLVSPDGQRVAFSRNYNIWVRDLKTNEERALTTDGEEYYQYAIPGSIFGNNGFISVLGLQAIWSPDSKRLLTVQLDQRQVKTIGVVSHVPPDGSLRPQTSFRKLAFPGDTYVEEYRLLAIDIETAHVQEASYGRVPVTYGGSGGFFENSFGWWSTDNKSAYFVDVDRYYKYVRVVEFNTHTGATKNLFEETSPTRVDLTMGASDQAHFVPLPETHELLWYSDRSDWSHYYLYDLKTGQLKNTVTSGQWLVRDIIHFDAKRRALFVTTSGRTKDKDRDPYYRDLVRVNVDTGEISTLISSNHEIITVSPKDLMQSLNGYAGLSSGVSPTGNYAVVTRSRVDQMPESYLLDRNGKKILDLEIPDSSNLPKNWQWPEPVTMKAADGKTDIYGVIYRPSYFSPTKSYPIIDQSFIGYILPIAAKGAFGSMMASSLGLMYFEAAALAELGFIVVQIDGRGSRYRGKAFRDESYGWINSASHIDDHVAGIKQLAERFSYMDLSRVGICGLHMGGNGVLEGLLKHPDFYKVGTAAQLYDARIMGANQGDFDEGLVPNPNEKYPEELVNNLKGKMLLMVGLQDYVPPAATFRIVEALQKANKDFDLVVEPNWGYSASTYQIRRAWDYLVQHLKGEQPPKEFNL